MPRWPRLCIVATAGALALAGCGDGAERKNAYVQEVNTAYTRLANTFTNLQSTVTRTSTPLADSRALAAYRAAAQRAVGELRAIKPPDGVAPLHRELVDRVAAYDRELERAERAFSSRDSARVLKARTDLTTATRRTGDRINDTITRINAKLAG
jgi:hypothetical protein